MIQKHAPFANGAKSAASRNARLFKDWITRLTRLSAFRKYEGVNRVSLYDE